MHLLLYMPLWDAQELMDAADTLQLRITRPLQVDDAFPRDRATGRHDQEVLYRFDVFGGTARPCLVDDDVHAQFLNLQLQELQSAISSVRLLLIGWTGWRSVGDVGFKDKRLALYHYVPSIDVYNASLQLASPYAIQLLCTQIKALSEADRKHFVAAVKLSSEAATLYRCVLVESTHELLGTGSYVNARQLEANGKNLKVQTQQSRPIGMPKSTFNGPESSCDGSPFKLESNALESIDALYVIKGRRAQAPWE